MSTTEVEGVCRKVETDTTIYVQRNRDELPPMFLRVSLAKADSEDVGTIEVASSVNGTSIIIQCGNIDDGTHRTMVVSTRSLVEAFLADRESHP